MKSKYPSIVAIIFMKYHSARVPKKNIRHLCGRPLFYWILNELRKSQYINKIIVDTDSKIIEKEIKKYFNDILVYQRPEWLYGDHIVANEILTNILNVFEGEFFLQTHSTNPLLKVKLIDKAIEQFFGNIKIYDSLFSVTELKTRVYDLNGKPINHDPDKLIMTQNIEPIYEENSNIYIFSKKSFKKYNNRIGKKPMFFIMKKEDTSDIDEEIDFKWCEFRLKEDLKYYEKVKSNKNS